MAWGWSTKGKKKIRKGRVGVAHLPVAATVAGQVRNWCVWAPLLWLHYEWTGPLVPFGHGISFVQIAFSLSAYTMAAPLYSLKRFPWVPSAIRVVSSAVCIPRLLPFLSILQVLCFGVEAPAHGTVCQAEPESGSAAASPWERRRLSIAPSVFAWYLGLAAPSLQCKAIKEKEVNACKCISLGCWGHYSKPGA